jgi:hypothetical protein
LLAALFISLSAAHAAAQARLSTQAAERLKEQAAECGKAFVEGDFARLADYTHPSLLAKVGGREGMIAFLKKGVAEMKAEGFEPLSYVNADPSQVLVVGRQTYAVVPGTLKMRMSSGVLVSETFMLAVSSDAGKSWKFVSGSAADAAKLKILFPAAAGRLKLPAEKPPTLESAP